MGKIVSKEEFRNVVRPKLKKANKTIALCHGVFDLVHPGHIIHFEQASQMADVLVVSITAAKYVRKGPGRPYFSDEMRMKFLEAIECIDYVMLSECYTVDDIVECVEPDFYVKGEEYSDESADVTENMKPERELVEKHGGQVRYTGGRVYSSTKLINRGLSGLPRDVIEFMEKFKKNYSMDDIKRYAQTISKMKVLVIGEIIIDRYTYCDVQGLMSKNMAYSARLLKTEDYLGGSAAIARHLSSFCKKVSLMSIVGNEPEMEHAFDELVNNKIDCVFEKSKEFPTIVKHRYLSPNAKRDEYTKVFVINNIPKDPQVDDDSLKQLKAKLKERIEEYDAVFLSDFGHGLFDEELIKILEDSSKFLMLNCQTNSSNYGMNNITKYNRCDAFSLDQKELRIALPSLAKDEKKALVCLKKMLGSDFAWLTKGAQGAWGLDGGDMVECPAFTLTVRDTIGAGDAFYSIAGAFASAGAPEAIGTVMGNIAGALGANILGNKSAVKKVDVLKFASTLLNI